MRSMASISALWSRPAGTVSSAKGQGLHWPAWWVLLHDGCREQELSEAVIYQATAPVYRGAQRIEFWQPSKVDLMFKRMLALCFVSAALAACSDGGESSATAPEDIQTAFFDMKLPGGLEDAKQSGFTECTSSYYSYECKRTDKVALYGIEPLTVRVNLKAVDTPGKKSEYAGKDVRLVPQEALGYNSIEAKFNDAVFDDGCENKVNGGTMSWPRPVQCIKNTGTTEQFVEALIKAGWVQTSKRRISEYAHKDEMVTINVFKDRDTAIIYKVERAVRDSLLRSYFERREEEKQKQEAASAVIEKMKSR